jgi:hypothetical protein
MFVTISIKSDKALGNPELPKELEREEELQLLGNESRRAEAIKRLSKKKVLTRINPCGRLLPP